MRRGRWCLVQDTAVLSSSKTNLPQDTAKPSISKGSGTSGRKCCKKGKTMHGSEI